MKSTLPTGKEVPLCIATPSREPAATMAYSGAFSQKYFKEDSAFGTSWISSKISKVSSLLTETPVSTLIARRILSTLISPSNTCCIRGLLSKLTYAVFSKQLAPNSFISQVFPTCLAPRMINGFRFFFSFHSFNRSNANRRISASLVLFTIVIYFYSISVKLPCQQK